MNKLRAEDIEIGTVYNVWCKETGQWEISAESYSHLDVAWNRWLASPRTPEFDQRVDLEFPSGGILCMLISDVFALTASSREDRQHCRARALANKAERLEDGITDED